MYYVVDVSMTHVNRWQTLCRTENFFALGLALAPLAPLGSDAIRFPNIWQAKRKAEPAHASSPKPFPLLCRVVARTSATR